jgi:hypothetical protein
MNAFELQLTRDDGFGGVHPILAQFHRPTMGPPRVERPPMWVDGRVVIVGSFGVSDVLGQKMDWSNIGPRDPTLTHCIAPVTCSCSRCSCTSRISVGKPGSVDHTSGRVLAPPRRPRRSTRSKIICASEPPSGLVGRPRIGSRTVSGWPTATVRFRLSHSNDVVDARVPAIVRPKPAWNPAAGLWLSSQQQTAIHDI